MNVAQFVFVFLVSFAVCFLPSRVPVPAPPDAGDGCFFRFHAESMWMLSSKLAPRSPSIPVTPLWALPYRCCYSPLRKKLEGRSENRSNKSRGEFSHFQKKKIGENLHQHRVLAAYCTAKQQRHPTTRRCSSPRIERFVISSPLTVFLVVWSHSIDGGLWLRR